MSWLPPDVVAERRRRIAEMTKSGMTAVEIAAVLGVSTRTVARGRELTGVSKPMSPRMTSVDLARAKQLFDDGCSAHEVSRTLGWCRSTLLKHFPGRGWTVEQSVEHQSLMRQMRQLT